MLTTWIREIADEPLLLDPTAHDAEIRENTWSLSAEDFPSVADVEAAFHECTSLLRERIRALGHQGTATFYVWHDAQAGFLKCSTTSLPANGLPFGARVELRALDEVVRPFLDDTTPGVVPFNDLVPVEDALVLGVWAVEVGT